MTAKLQLAVQNSSPKGVF